MSMHLPRNLAIGAGLLVVLGVGAQATTPEGGLPDPDVVPVVSTELVCPDAGSSADHAVTTVLSAVTPKPLVVGADGRAVIGAVSKPTTVATLSGAGYGTARTMGPGVGAVVGSAIAGRAPGFTMDQVTTSTKATEHGLFGTTCTQPENDMWFVGTGSDVGHESRLYLTDTEATPATVDVTLYGKNGRIDAPQGLGLVVGGNSRRVIRLDLLAPGAGPLAVRVTAVTGRVAAGVFDTQVNGLLPRGADWLPAAAPPATKVVVPGLASGAGSRRLSVFAPGEGSATVTVRLVGTQGSFSPSGAASFDVDRGRLTTVDLGSATTTDQTAAVVESDVPLVAGVRRTVTAGASAELAFTAGAAPLTGPAVMAGNLNDGSFRTTLMLTATGAATQVVVQPMAHGVPRGKAVTVSIGADRTVRLTMPGPPGWFEALITPKGGAPVYGAVVREKVFDGTIGTTISVVRDARIAVAVPEARPNLDVGVGR